MSHPIAATSDTGQFENATIGDGALIEPLVPIEVARHHVEVVRALYKSAAERQPVSLPLDKADPFYSFEGRLTSERG